MFEKKTNVLLLLLMQSEMLSKKEVDLMTENFDMMVFKLRYELFTWHMCGIIAFLFRAHYKILNVSNE